ncbi:GyrI-like domain-containing protein [Tumebacillus lipolyticus]|uniref:GyrI-like domain-containing protein n=1 Tax=Tumebacillus lipolyticus TaxID=1280370 RepID=A0ABW4ZZY2_9BACL
MVASSRLDSMVTHEVAAHRYAVFTHRNKLNTLGSTYDHIYKSWLPTSEHERDFAAPYLEFYGERFAVDKADSELEIWLPIK